MEEKKSFFALLEPKSAMLVGVVGGVLTICTIGFIILGTIYLKGAKFSSLTSLAIVPNNDTVEQNNQLPPPPDVPKSNRPKAELFVMSYCPFGLQMEKAFLPVMELFKDKADLEIKFVSYAMHGLKEIEENTRQYCVNKEQSAKFIPYMRCFTGKDDSPACITEARVDARKMQRCVDATNRQYGIMDKYNNQNTWLSGRYPLYPVHESANKQYNVGGSPTLVINGVEAQVARSPEAVKQAICAAFNNAPAECRESLSTAQPVAGFGGGVDNSGAAAAAGCGS